MLVLAGVAAVGYWPRRSSGNAEALYARGANPLSAADGETAFRELVEKYPDSPRIPAALIGLGQYMISRGDRAGALQVYRQVIDRFPTDSARPRAFVLSAMVQLDSGDTVAACRSISSTDSAAVADRFLMNKMEQIGALCPPTAALDSARSLP
jgi:TolA-binding protein